MEIKEFKGVEYKVIDPQDLADYIETVYNNESFRTFLLSKKTKDICEQTTNRLSDILVKYYLATGDNRESSIESIIESFASHPVDYRNISGINDVKFHQFRYGAYPFIVDYWKKELGMEEASFVDMQEILTVAATHSSLNAFETHSFNGALKKSVERNGLNINNELFKNNFEYLSRMTSSVYETGNLYVCPLSEGSWGYMHHSPERLWMTIGSSSITREVGETDNEFAKRSFDDVLAKNAGIYEESYLDTARVLGEEMIDFYTQSDDVCMAIRRRGNPSVEECYERNSELIGGKLNYGFQLPYALQRAFPRELVTKLNGIALRGNQVGTIEDIERIIEEMKLASPGKIDALDSFVEHVFSANMATYSVSNYMHVGNADGLKIEGGYLPRESFALATIKDPSREYDVVEQQKKIKK